MQPPSPADRARGPRFSREQLIAVAVVLAGTFVAAVDTTIAGTAMPTAIGDLGGIDRYSWVFSSYLLASTATTPIFGRLADVLGRKSVYATAFVVFVGASVLCGLASTMNELIVFRALQGLGGGALLSTGSTIIGDLFDPRGRGRAQSLVSTVWAIAAVLGPGIGGVITQALSWRWAFFVNLPIGLVALTLLLVGVHEHGVRRSGRIDWLGALLIASATTALLLGVSNAMPLVTLPLALVFAALFVVRERRTPAPLVELHLVTTPVIGTGLALMFLMGALGFGSVAYVPPFAQGVLGRSPVEAGSALASISIAWLFTSVLVGMYMIPIGLRRASIAGSLSFVVGAGILVALPQQAPLALLVVGAAWIGLAQGWQNTPLLVAAQTAVGQDRRGVVTSLMNFSRNLGAAVGVAVLGAVLNATIGQNSHELLPLLDPANPATGPAVDDARALLSGGLHAVFIAMGLLALASLVFALRLPRTHEYVEPPVPARSGQRADAASS